MVIAVLVLAGISTFWKPVGGDPLNGSLYPVFQAIPVGCDRVRCPIRDPVSCRKRSPFGNSISVRIFKMPWSNHRWNGVSKTSSPANLGERGRPEEIRSFQVGAVEGPDFPKARPSGILVAPMHEPVRRECHSQRWQGCTGFMRGLTSSIRSI